MMEESRPSRDRAPFLPMSNVSYLVILAAAWTSAGIVYATRWRQWYRTVPTPDRADPDILAVARPLDSPAPRRIFVSWPRPKN
jgi:hypothetical protein